MDNNQNSENGVSPVAANALGGGNSITAQEPFWRNLVVVLVPVFLTSFLFAGLLEEYKSGVSTNVKALDEGYRPMRETFVKCHGAMRDLSEKTAGLSGSFELMLDQFEKMAGAKVSSRGDDVLMQSFYLSNKDLKSEVATLSAKVDTCASELYRRYEDVAIMTGTYDDFSRVSSKYSAQIHDNAVRYDGVRKVAVSGIDPKELVEKLRGVITVDSPSESDKAKIHKSLRDFGGPVIAATRAAADMELKRAQIEADLYNEIRPMFAKEISERFKEGFLAKVL